MSKKRRSHFFGKAAVLLRFTGLALIITGALDIRSVCSLLYQVKRSRRGAGNTRNSMDVDYTDA